MTSMSHLQLVESHRGEMELEGDSVMVVIETDEDTGIRVRVRWKLQLHSETNTSQIFRARNEERGLKIVKRITSSTLSKNELGALVWLNAVCALQFSCELYLTQACSPARGIFSSNSIVGLSTSIKSIV